MKPIKLEIEGLHSFTENQVFDFTKIASNKVFGIFGATGSGKSTVLDAIVLALYGNVQRSRSNVDFINLKTKQTKVVFVFEYNQNVNIEKYEVVRTFKLGKDGEVTQKAQVSRFVKGEEKELVMDGANKVDAYLKDLVGLTQNEFSKCVALPQGEFAGFLKAKPIERINIIGGIFDLNKYGEKLWEKARIKATETKESLANIDGKINAYADVNDSVLDEIKGNVKDLESKIEANQAQMADFKATINEEEEFAKYSIDLQGVEKSLNSLMAEGVTIYDKKQQLLRAKCINSNSLLINSVNSLAQKMSAEQEEIKRLTAEHLIETDNTRQLVEHTQNTMHQVEDNIANLSARREQLSVAQVISEQLRNLRFESSNIMIELNDIELKKADVIQDKAEIEKEIEDLNLEYEKTQQKCAELTDQLQGLNEVTSYKALKENSDTFSDYLRYTNEKLLKAVNLKANANQKISTLNKDHAELVKELRSIRRNNMRGLLYSETSPTSVITEAINSKVILLGKINVTEEYVSNLSKNIAEIAQENSDRQNKIKAIKLQQSEIVEQNGRTNVLLKDLKAKLQQLEETRTQIICNNSVAEFADKHKIGDTCPICSHEIITKNVMGKLSCVMIDQDILNTKAQIEETLKISGKELCDIAQLEQQIIDQQKEIEQNNVQANNINKEIASKCANLLNKKNAKLSDISIVQLRIKQEIEELNTKKEKEVELLNQISGMEAQKAKYNSIFVSASEKVSEFSEIVSSLEATKKDTDDRIAKIENGKKIEVKLKEFDAVQEEVKDAQEQIEYLHTKIVEHSDELRALIEKYSAMCASADVKSKRLQELNEEIKSKEELNVNYKNITSFSEEILAIDAQINLGKTEINSGKVNIDKLNEKLAVIESALMSKNQIFNEHSQLHTETYTTLMTELNAVNIQSLQEVSAYSLSPQQIEELEKFVNSYDGDLAMLTARKQELESKLCNRVVDPVVVNGLIEQVKKLGDETNSLIEQCGREKQNLATKLERLETLNALNGEKSALQEKYNRENEMCELLRGKALLEYVAEEFIDDITHMATNRLQDLIDGRYILKYKDKEFFVIDNFNNGEERSACTLSGGELFVVSLSLALSISDALLTRSDKRIDFFFLDEGFGTLDKEYCDYIVSTLCKIGAGSLLVGLISHIPELQEKITHKFIVTKPTANSGSKVEYVEEG